MVISCIRLEIRALPRLYKWRSVAHQTLTINNMDYSGLAIEQQLELNPMLIRLIAKHTVGQWSNNYFVEVRRRLLTASLFGEALSAARPNCRSRRGFISKWLNYGQRRDVDRASVDNYFMEPMRWGMDHEKFAVCEYCQVTHQDVKSTGL